MPGPGRGPPQPFRLPDPRAREPSVTVAIIGELGQRLHSMNTPLAYLTYAARALARDEYDDAIVRECFRSPHSTGSLLSTAIGPPPLRQCGEASAAAGRVFAVDKIRLPAAANCPILDRERRLRAVPFPAVGAPRELCEASR